MHVIAALSKVSLVFPILGLESPLLIYNKSMLDTILMQLSTIYTQQVFVNF